MLMLGQMNRLKSQLNNIYKTINKKGKAREV